MFAILQSSGVSVTIGTIRSEFQVKGNSVNIIVFNPPGPDDLGFVREGRCEQRLSSFQYVMLPVSLTYIAAVLRRDGFSVRIVDAVAEKRPRPELLTELQAAEPQLVFFNVSTVTYPSDIAFARELRAVLPTAHFTAIGVHVTATPRQSLEESVFDSVIRGEPEAVGSALARALQERRPLHDVAGLFFKEDGLIVENPAAEPIADLDSLPFPARDLVKNELYTLPVINRPYTLLVPSRGCPYPCIFCTAHRYYGKKLRFRSVESVVAELREIVQVHDVHYVTMWSDTFTFRKEFVIELCRRIIEEKLDLRWMCNSRVDTIDEEMLQWMARSGCIGISYGIESADQEVLDNICKHITPEQVRTTVALTNKYGIESLAHIIFGLPGDTPEKIRKTIRFIKKIRPSYAQFYCAVPFPGTEFHRQAVANGWLTTDDWSRFEINQAIIATPALSAAEMNRLRKRAYLQFYLDPVYLWNRLRKIRSWSDLRTNVRQGWDFIRNWVVAR